MAHLAARRSDGDPAERHQKNPRLLDPLPARLHGDGRRPCAPEAGMFHLYTHAWFKALLFLGSGAVIYACHHEQDIWKMGGLLRKMPITAITFLIGTMALTAVPFTAGFYSKEGILQHASGQEPCALLARCLCAALLTTFYMFRLLHRRLPWQAA